MHAVLGRQAFDQAPHPAVTDEQQPGQLPTVSAARRPCSAVRKEHIVQPRHRRRDIGVAQHDGHVPARGGLRHHPQRKPLERAEHARGDARVAPQAVAHGAQDRHAMLGLHLGELRQVSITASSRRSSSTVTDTLTSDVVTTSTDVRWRSNTSKTRRR